MADQLSPRSSSASSGSRGEEVGSDDIKDVYGEAKANGFDTKVLRKIVSLRKQDRDERMEQEAILELYLQAMGMA